MKKLIAFVFFISLFASGISFGQSTTLGEDSIKVIGEDTLVGPPIVFRQYNERFVDFMFFDGNFNVVSFRIMEKSTSFQFMISSLDSSVYCFQTDPDEFKMLLAMVKEMNAELMAQSNWPVKCNYCQTMQMFWFEGDHERSTLKRSVAIPQSFNQILDYCYEISSTEKRKCQLELKNFQSLEGFSDKLRGPSANK
ncbi:MAG: hypothetical protein KBD42_05490 [Chitinophagales bacterium]|nr:hypothetical protein [Chitinophagales bacterium]